MTSATEVLRRLLDELNIKHFDYHKGGWTQTQWEAPDGNRHFTYETYDNPAKTAKLVISWFPTPEQAIAATLGAGTCKPREVRSRFSKTQEYVTYHCECGHELGGYMTAELPFPHTYNEDKLPNYCPNCGRKIVDPTTNDVDAEVGA